MSGDEKRNRLAHAIFIGKMRRVLKWIIIIGIVAGAIIYSRQAEDPNNPIVSTEGVHYHAHLAISVDGKDVPVPQGIGLIPGQEHPHQMHTHESDQIIHVEIPGRVRAHDVRLSNFFAVWGQPFTKDNLLGNIVTEGKTLTMTVNGVVRQDFEQYEIRDKDEIQITLL